MNLELAQKEHISEVRKLINLAYRGEQGWTNERNFISGDRTSDTDIERAISKKDSHFLIYEAEGCIIASVCVEIKGYEAIISLLAVHPDYQAQGLGTKILLFAENHSAAVHGSTLYTMTVLSIRHELIAFYERRGYKRNGSIKDFPLHQNVGIPKVSNLKFVCLEKPP